MHAAFFRLPCHTYRISEATTKTINTLEEWTHIIAACKRGEHQAQCEAYKRSWRIIYPAVYNVLRSREEAEDVMQESIIKGFERLNELKEPQKYIGWQKMISLRTALNKLRSQKSMTALFGELDGEDVIEDVNDTMPIALEALKCRMEKMPQGYRIVLKLYLEEGMSHEEIGEHLGISAATSRSQYCRAIAKLKKELTK